MEKIKRLLSSETPVRWVFSGDSITHGALHTYGERDYTELFSERIRFEMRRSLDIVIKTAISGTSTFSPLENFNTLIGQFAPHVVFLMFGMNDCSAEFVPPEKFESNLNDLVDRITSIGAIPILQTTCPVLPNSRPEREPYLDKYMDIIRKTAEVKEIELIDHNLFWKNNGSDLHYWMNDAIHPNAFGHRIFARLIFETMGIFDAAGSNTCAFFVPGLSISNQPQSR
ncbi:MAG: SGNH/GDSL hydrolase family protein [Lentisphaerota bacterium]